MYGRTLVAGFPGCGGQEGERIPRRIVEERVAMRGFVYSSKSWASIWDWASRIVYNLLLILEDGRGGGYYFALVREFYGKGIFERPNELWDYIIA